MNKQVWTKPTVSKVSVKASTKGFPGGGFDSSFTSRFS